MQQQMQEKKTSVEAPSEVLGLNIHKEKSKILRFNTTCTNQITLEREDLRGVKTLTYLGVKAWIGKARAVYLLLKRTTGTKTTVNQQQGQNFQYKCQDSTTV
ncbi:unnamed protein product [Schistosoma curassoni]|uniref:Ovule protein n=1 Tax=Schistosoma curassoni TaxID=6186 RepID=A0A183K248_9TREM|nr:unnamed protein product [Schistosoma curassoni]